jgi:hypothetical protein
MLPKLAVLREGSEGEVKDVPAAGIILAMY